MADEIRWRKVWQIQNDGERDETFYVPCGLAIDHRGRIVVVDGLKQVQIFTYFKNESEVIVKERIGSNSILPQYVAVYDRKYFVTDLTSQSVFVCDSEGRRIKFFKTNKLIDPLGIAINETTGVVYIANKGKKTISMFSKRGRFAESFDQRLSPESKLVNPWGVAVNRQNFVFVSDRDRHCINRYDAGGYFYSKFGSEGSEPGKLKNPEGIAVDDVGNVYVCDNGNNRVQIFDKEGTFVSCLSGDTELLNPKGIAIDIVRNRVLVSAYNTVYVFERV